ncbi:MAG: hypothetical protein R3Y43_02075 [Alphaproteobacteria bacterium]
MKLKTLLLTSAAILGATNAMATDITSPFYLPEIDEGLSTTSVEYSRVNMDETSNQSKGWYVKEEIAYGLSDNLALTASIGNTFDNKWVGREGDYNNSHNFDYSVGAKYNEFYGNVLTQYSFTYETFQAKSFGLSNSDAWNQYFDLGAKLGYEFDCGLLPYVSFNATYGYNTVDNAARNNDISRTMSDPKEGKFAYSTFAGVFKQFENTSAEFGVRWDNVRHSDSYMSRDDVFAEAQFDYLISDSMSVGVYGEYYVGGSYRADIDYDYTVGANLKMAF